MANRGADHTIVVEPANNRVAPVFSSTDPAQRHSELRQLAFIIILNRKLTVCLL